ncbi:MAG: hypothetical protein COA79_25175 [Planctomycetota bacterium]|nr:MAG: hypothetical protein COA79_25175 [Planctomycetota bacterium]
MIKTLFILITLSIFIFIFFSLYNDSDFIVEMDSSNETNDPIAINETYEEHVSKLKKKLPNKKFHIIIQKPFVVIGDMPQAILESRWAKGTVKWTVENLKKSYFKKDPKSILDIWLFKDKESYRKHTKLLWGSVPDTPYGYYSPHHKVLVMNISTGGGTLVHEIVHPFMEANFPNCPPWFNEGLGSLYEQSAFKKEKIWGLTNWRLAGLKKVINKGKLPTFKKLMALNDNQFYGGDGGYSDNYAQSRYLLYYLQEKSLLRIYYIKFTKNQIEDPSGFDTLKKLLKEKDMMAFQKRWEAYVLKLKFRGS